MSPDTLMRLQLDRLPALVGDVDDSSHALRGYIRSADVRGPWAYSAAMRSALFAILAACGGSAKPAAPPPPVEPALQITLDGKPLAIQSMVAMVDGFDVMVVVSSGPEVCTVPKQGDGTYVFRIGRLLHPDGSYGCARDAATAAAGRVPGPSSRAPSSSRT